MSADFQEPPKGGTLTAAGVTSPEVKDNRALPESRVYAEPQTVHRKVLMFGFMESFRLKAGL